MRVLAEVTTSNSGRHIKPNLARWKQASQSPKKTDLKYGATKAVDGLLSTCSSTRPAQNAWWQLDLEIVYGIEAVAITTPSRGELIIRTIAWSGKYASNNVCFYLVEEYFMH